MNFIYKKNPDKVMKGIFLTILPASLLINAAMFFLVITGYQLRYPRLSLSQLSQTQIWILIFTLLPSAVSLMGVLAMLCFKTCRVLHGLLTAVLIPAVILGGIGTLVFLAVPPICSETRNQNHYLEIDQGLGDTADVLSALFPKEIPTDVKAVDYHYFKYSAVALDRVTITASWELPSKEYLEAKKQALDSVYLRSVKKEAKGKTGSASMTAYPEQINISFEYNDELRKVSYAVSREIRH